MDISIPFPLSHVGGYGSGFWSIVDEYGHEFPEGTFFRVLENSVEWASVPIVDSPDGRAVVWFKMPSGLDYDRPTRAAATRDRDAWMRMGGWTKLEL